ncbi:hypothetical protein O59_004014 [Cellvibrio sp. BR]|uniref:hypothetical protein n=1 Tax=Cellvibrio sp. BR TaxID=1134474 RepID=UPI0002600AE0|nr:hypothetical protein [Cellvibrio sp. BR]EIK43221.1 hypothetical protein O59_004014 [Cellvibrio sp. BR]
MSALKSTLLLFILTIVFFNDKVLAQDNSAARLPVITLEQDFNGVDVTSGSYVTRSPFNLANPAASKLGISTYFSGRSFGFSLNTYFRDETYTSYGFDPSIRELTVVFEGRSYFFKCTGVGACVDLNYLKDGSSLVRLSMRPAFSSTGEDRYRFTYRDGTLVNFFDPTYTALQYCPDDDGCNAAIYHAYGYASNIKYPSGEMLTFDPLITKGYDTDGVYRAFSNIQSNLGYTLNFATEVPTNYVIPTKAGVFWQRQILAEDKDIKITLKQNNIDVSWVQGKRTFETIPNFGLSLKTFEQIDSIGRVSKWEFQGKFSSGCFPPNIDIRQSVITRETSPGGIVTEIKYHDAVNRMFHLWQVKSVKRGNNTWNYTYDSSVNPQVTVTDAYGGKRITLPSIGYNPLSTANGGCTAAIPGKPTRYTDELNRVTNVKLDTNSNEIAEITYPSGHGYIYQRDARSNITATYEKPSNGTSSVIIYKANYTSNCANALVCNQVNWTEDAKGNRTNYTYFESHGGIKTKTMPSNNDGVYRRDFYFYEGLNTGNGTVYRMIRQESCGLIATQLTATTCPVNADTKVQSTIYWKKTFLPESVTLTDGLGNSPLTTIYSYNDLGLIVNTNGPRNDINDVSYRTYDAVGRLIFEISPLPGGECQNTGQACRVRKMVKHYYNKDDQEVRTEIGSGNAINGSDFLWSSALKMTYDNSGKLIKTEELVP